MRQVDDLTVDFTIDILNLLFGSDNETDAFHTILNEQVQYDFGYKKHVDVKKLHKGALLNAICYHCNINMVYSAEIFTSHQTKLHDYEKFKKKTRSNYTVNFLREGEGEEIDNPKSKIIQIFTKDNYVETAFSSQVFSMDSL